MLSCVYWRIHNFRKYAKKDVLNNEEIERSIAIIRNKCCNKSVVSSMKHSKSIINNYAQKNYAFWALIGKHLKKKFGLVSNFT